MTQYINKAALVAEIERRKKELIKLSNDFANQWACGSLDNILSFLDTLEVKGVDLEKVFLDEYSKFSNDVDAMDYAFPIDLADYKDFAKHFFELGLKAAQNNN